MSRRAIQEAFEHGFLLGLGFGIILAAAVLL